MNTSANFDATSPRFHRPLDAGRTPRNLRRIQAQRLLALASKALLVAGIIIAGLWIYRQTQSDRRFAVRHIEITGARHTPREALESVTNRYVGLNLFKIDIARVQHDLHGLRWVRRIDIEKKLPDTLRINVTERVPVALVRSAERISYVDDEGVTFAELSPAVGDDDLPLIDCGGQAPSPVQAGGGTGEIACPAEVVAFVRALRASDPALYSRVSEVSPIAPHSFALFDRELGAFVYANAEDVSLKWRNLYSVVRAEGLVRGTIEYADLRFADRIVVKPVHPITSSVAAPIQPAAPAQITN
jgi:hypothetical protein